MDNNYYGNICYCRKCNGIVHTIKQGDTLYLLSRYYHVPIGEIMNANRNMNVYNLRIGEEICIPIRREDMQNDSPGMPENTTDTQATVENMEFEQKESSFTYLKDVINRDDLTLSEFKKMLEEIS